MSFKSKLPSAAQAKRIARCWAEDRPINVMFRGRDGGETYNDATNLACIKNGWISPAGIQFEENGFLWVSHKVTPDALFALECYLQKLRFDADPPRSHQITRQEI